MTLPHLRSVSLAFLVAAFCVNLTGCNQGHAKPASPPAKSDVAGEEQITASDALKYAGQHKIVCGYVAGAKYATKSRGQPTFLDIDKPYPNQVMTVLIWGSDRGNFENAPESQFLNKAICVSGTIKMYKDKAEIVVKSESQIEVRN